MDHWHFIKDAMIKAFPPIAEESDENFLVMQEQFLIGEMDCWFGVESLDAQDIIAVMTTKVVREDVTGTKNMLIFSVTSYQLHSMDLWIDGYDTLRKYSAAKGCRKIISFSNNPRVLEVAKTLGADIEWRLIQLEV